MFLIEVDSATSVSVALVVSKVPSEEIDDNFDVFAGTIVVGTALSVDWSPRLMRRPLSIDLRTFESVLDAHSDEMKSKICRVKTNEI